MESNKILLLGIGLAFVFWFVDAFADSLVGEGAFGDQLLSPDPTEIWMRLTIAALIIGFAVYVQRTSGERTRTRERLRLLELAVQSADDPILITTSELDFPGPEIIYVNEALCRQTGYTAEELLGETPRIFQGPGTERAVLDRLRGALERGEDFLESTINYRKDGSEYLIEWRTSPVRNSAGDLTHWVSVQRDITERKRTEVAMQEIREAERRQLARDLHDEVLQDLVDALYSMQITKLRLEDEGMTNAAEELDKETDNLRDAVQGLRGVVHNLRRGGIQEQPFLHLLRSVVELTRQKVPDTEISLDVDEAEASNVTGIAAMDLLRIIQEVLVNTRRHSGARRVRIKLGVEENEIRMEVSDDGRGFETEAAWGGVGLSAMQERALKLGGNLEIYSEPGKGTRVTVSVPASVFADGTSVAGRN